MRILLTCILALGLMSGGCAWFSSNDSSQGGSSAAPIENQPSAEVAPVPEAKQAPMTKAEKAAKAKAVKAEKAAQEKADKAAKADSAKKTKSLKTEAEIRAALEATGHKLAAQAARTVMPSKASKEVQKDGKNFVASYVEIDTQSVTTEMRPGTAGQYVGFIRYPEKVYECRGATKQAALSAPCSQVRTRRINELIRFDGKAWQY